MTGPQRAPTHLHGADGYEMRSSYRFCHHLELLEQSRELAADRGEPASRACGSRHHDDVDTGHPRHRTGSLAHQPLRAVALHRAANATGRDHRDTWGVVVIAQPYVDGQKPARPLPSPTEHGRDVAAVPEAIGSGGAHRVTRTAWNGRDDGDP